MMHEEEIRLSENNRSFLDVNGEEPGKKEG